MDPAILADVRLHAGVVNAQDGTLTAQKDASPTDPSVVPELGVIPASSGSTSGGVDPWVYLQPTSAASQAIGIATASESNGTVTITTSAAHAFVAGQQVSIGAEKVPSPTGYDGDYTIASVIGSTQFTYADSSTRPRQRHGRHRHAGRGRDRGSDRPGSTINFAVHLNVTSPAGITAYDAGSLAIQFNPNIFQLSNFATSIPGLHCRHQQKLQQHGSPEHRAGHGFRRPNIRRGNRCEPGHLRCNGQLHGQPGCRRPMSLLNDGPFTTLLDNNGTPVN